MRNSLTRDLVAFSELAAIQLLNAEQYDEYRKVCLTVSQRMPMPHGGHFDPVVLAGLMVSFDLTLVESSDGLGMRLLQRWTQEKGALFFPPERFDSINDALDQARVILRTRLPDAARRASGKTLEFLLAHGISPETAKRHVAVFFHSVLQRLRP